MALGFSQGLLGGLRQFGQGGEMPSDPNQRNVMQQYGVTNPLLQQFGQSLGMLAGRDMRSAQQQSAGVLGEAMTSGSWQKQMEAAKKLLDIGMTEQGAALFKLAQDAKNKEETQRKAEVKGGYDKASAIQGLNTLVESGKITDAKRTQLIQGITSGVIPFDTIQQYVAREMGLTPTERGAAKSLKGEIYKDKDGNMYRTVTRIGDNGAQDQYIPIGDAPPYAKQKLEMVYGETGMSYTAGKQTQTELEQQKAENKKFGDLKVTAAAALPDLLTSSNEIDRALELLQTVQTGGPINTAGTALENFTGTMSADKAELQVILGNAMYRQLKPLFGGVISEGEREVIENLYASLKKGNPANTGILRDMARAVKSSVGNTRELLKANTFEEYKDILLKLSEPTGPQETTVNWNDL